MIKKITKEETWSSLEKYFDKDITTEEAGCICGHDYKILKCAFCKLEFSHPLVPASEKYYNWVSKYKKYYPQDRPEWNKVIELLEGDRNKKIDILEVGCGSGFFLSKISTIFKNAEIVGVDTTEKSVAECKRKSLKVYCGDLREYLAESKQNKKFDFIFSFHVLEHIDDINSFIVDILKALKKDGSLFLSTPYSPMYHELFYFDPLNYPPHHMTRWNINAYRELAEKHGLKIKYFFMEQNGVIIDSLNTLNIYWNGILTPKSLGELLLQICKTPLLFPKVLMAQAKREKIDGKRAGNIIMVQLSR